MGDSKISDYMRYRRIGWTWSFVLFLEKGTTVFSTHENLIMQNKNYEKLYKTQCNALKNDLDIKPTEGAK